MDRESKIETWLNTRIKLLGGKSYKFISPGNPGVPDRIYLLPGGRVYFVELKCVTGKLSKIQRWQREQFLQMGVPYGTVYGMGQAKDLVKEIEDEIHTAQVSGLRNQ